MSKTQLDTWVNEGRVAAEALLLEPGGLQWLAAAGVYPDLAKAQPIPIPAARAADPAQASETAELHRLTTRSSSDNGTASLSHPGIRKALAGTQPWVRFIGLLAWISCGLSLLGVLGIAATLVVSADRTTRGASGGGIVAAVGIIYLVMAAVTGGMGHCLWRYAASIGRYLRSNSVRVLETALVAQETYWRLVGFCAAAYLCLVILFAAVVAIRTMS
jgi:hypothetical protein